MHAPPGKFEALTNLTIATSISTIFGLAWPIMGGAHPVGEGINFVLIIL